MTYQQEINSLLELIDSPVVSQKIYLVATGIIKSGEDEVSGAAYLEESFADLAFRLRDGAIKTGVIDWVTVVCEVIEYCEGQKYCSKCGQKHKTKKLFDWSADAQPIHWIVAALIAQVMLMKEMREH